MWKAICSKWNVLYKRVLILFTNRYKDDKDKGDRKTKVQHYEKHDSEHRDEYASINPVYSPMKVKSKQTPFSELTIDTSLRIHPTINYNHMTTEENRPDTPYPMFSYIRKKPEPYQ